MYPTFLQIFVYILYTFVYKMYAKCLYTNVSHILTNFCVQNVYKMFVYKMYTTFRQTFIYILYTKCIQKLSKYGVHFVYILYTSVVYIFYIQFLYTKCIYSSHVGSPCIIYLMHFIVKNDFVRAKH